jgi:hypothetical protein
MELELEKTTEEKSQQEEVAVTEVEEVKEIEEQTLIAEKEEVEQVEEEIIVEEEKVELSQEESSSSALSILMGVEDSILEREYVEQNVRKFLLGLGRAVLRSDSLDGDMKRMFASAKEYYLGGILASPLYLNACAKLLKKKENQL